MPPTEGVPEPSDPAETPDPADHINLALIDDHPTVRSAIRSAAEDTMDIEVVAESSSAEEAFQWIEEQEPDVAVVDLSLSDGHGFDLLGNLQAHCPETSILVFSMYDETVYAERVLRAGASGYLMKAASAAEVLRAVRRVHEGGVYLSGKMTERVLKKMVEGQAEEARFPIDELTDRELQVFQMLGQGLTLSEIADRLSLARKTVETYRRRAKEKLGVDSAEKVVAHAARWTLAQPQTDEEDAGLSDSRSDSPR